VGPQQLFAFQHFPFPYIFICHNCHSVVQVYYCLNQQIQLQL